MLKNIFFDFNGTLIDDLDFCVDIEKQVAKKAGIEPYSKKFYLETFSFPVRNFYKTVGLKDEDYVTLSSYFNNEYYSHYKEKTCLFDGVKDTLLDLKKSGFKVYCLSASPYEYLKSQLSFFEILDLFDGICGATNNLANGKIDYGKIFIEKNKINPKETIMIGDTLHDYEVGKTFGFSCILFSKGHNSKDRLLSSGAPVVDSYKEIYEEIIKENEKAAN